MNSPNYMDLDLQFAGSPLNLRMGPEDYHGRHNWNAGRHCNADYEIHIMLAGSCTLEVGNQDINFQAAKAVLIAPGTFHGPHNLSEDFERFCFSFMPTRQDFSQLQISPTVAIAVSAFPVAACQNFLSGNLRKRLRDLHLVVGDPGDADMGAACGGEILFHVRRDLGGDKEIAAFFAYTDVTHGFPGDACPHERTQKVPVAGGISMVKFRPKADQGRILIGKGIFIQVFGQVNEHFPLGIGIPAEGMKALDITEEIPCHFQLPGGEKTGIGKNVFPDTCVYFVPYFCQKNLIFRIPGDFINIASIQIYHQFVL